MILRLIPGPPTVKLLLIPAERRDFMGLSHPSFTTGDIESQSTQCRGSGCWLLARGWLHHACSHRSCSHGISKHHPGAPAWMGEDVAPITPDLLQPVCLGAGMERMVLCMDREAIIPWGIYSSYCTGREQDAQGWAVQMVGNDSKETLICASLTAQALAPSTPTPPGASLLGPSCHQSQAASTL